MAEGPQDQSVGSKNSPIRTLQSHTQSAYESRPEVGTADTSVGLPDVHGPQRMKNSSVNFVFSSCTTPGLMDCKFKVSVPSYCELDFKSCDLCSSTENKHILPGHWLTEAADGLHSCGKGVRGWTWWRLLNSSLFACWLHHGARSSRSASPGVAADSSSYANLTPPFCWYKNSCFRLLFRSLLIELRPC